MIHPNASLSLRSRFARPTVIFLSITSNPQAAPSYTEETSPKQYAAEAKPLLANIKDQQITRRSIGSLKEAARTASGDAGAEGGGDSSNTKNILLCGWRFVWNTHVKRFKARVEELSHNLPEGSVVYCLNRQTPEAFEALLLGEDGAAAGFEKRRKKKVDEDEEEEEEGKKEEDSSYTNAAFKGGTVTVKHWCGDPTRFGEVEKLFRSLPAGFYFTSAICLGSVPGLDLPSHAQDARILSMLMILRKISSKSKAPTPMHIIAENTEDQT